MTGEQARQRHGGGAGQHGEHPPGGHPRDGAGRLGRQRDRGHQQRDPGRLHHDEVAVRQRPVDQPDGAAEVGPVVVFGDPEQVAGPAQLIQPERQANQGRHDDHRGRRPGPGEPATGAPGRDGRREPGAGRCRRRSAHGWVTPHVVRGTRNTWRPWPLPGPGPEIRTLCRDLAAACDPTRSPPPPGWLSLTVTRQAAIGLVAVWHDKTMNQAERSSATGGGVRALGHEVFEIDTRMAGHDKITAGYLIRATGRAWSRPAPRRRRGWSGTRSPGSASAPGSGHESWSPTSTWTMPAGPATSPHVPAGRRSWCTSGAPGTWPTPAG